MTSNRGTLLTSLRNAESLGPELAGHKAWVLGRLAVAGFSVPEGLVLTADALGLVLEGAELGADATPEQVRAAGWPQTVKLAVQEIAAHFAGTPLAVRSSAAEEDLTGESYAGQYTTELRVSGEHELGAAIRDCWASAFGTTVRAYRGEPSAPRIAVLVQPMVDADVAGVAFTADPLTGDHDEVLVSAVPGTAEQLAGGTLTPDEWRVRDAGGQQDTAIPHAVSHQALTERQACAVAALARRVETELDGPQDVEWAMAGQRLLLLQARPITALPRAAVVDLPPGTWVKEVERHPEPLTAFGASLAAPMVAAGLTEMAASWGALVERFDAHPVGGEPYMRVTPVGGDRASGPTPPWWLFGALARVVPPLRARMRTARRMLRPEVLHGALDDWERVHRPRIREEHALLAAVDLAGLDDAGLDQHMGRVLDFASRCLRLHFWLIPPYAVPVYDLVAFCHRHLDWDDSRSLLLLAGTSTSTVEPHRELRRIAALPAADVGTELAGWVTRYGVRCVNNDPGSPTLAERPELVAAMLREAADDAADAKATAIRDETVAQARLLLADRPAGTRARFETVLEEATRAYPLREDSAFWTSSMTGGLMRLAMVEAGRRLTSDGLLHEPEEAANLDADTLRSLLRGPRDSRARSQARDLLTRNRAERVWASRNPGPAYHGPAPSEPPSFRGLPGAGRRLNDALDWSRSANQGGPAPHARGPEATRGATLLGSPGSPGVHRGPVRVVLGEADFARVRTGDVLVCATTDPAWSVLFGIAGALVTDRGGVLSHAAIVAREFGIPAVLATTRGTEVLRNGQQVTVDGSMGRVVLEPAPPDPRENNTSTLEMT
ncbi:MAG TPA: PEP/pyruvate-binding domain-containing protein [Nocardioidaceae bacterium]|nr:PEP/pyruvate-binding domain-containing protein [Nocardioidaceae bacterium]